MFPGPAREVEGVEGVEGGCPRISKSGNVKDREGKSQVPILKM